MSTIDLSMWWAHVPKKYRRPLDLSQRAAVNGRCTLFADDYDGIKAAISKAAETEVDSMTIRGVTLIRHAEARGAK